MDVLRRDTIKHLLRFIDDILLAETGVLGKSTSHSHTPTETEGRGRKSHTPSVTTVPREVTLTSNDRQARQKHIAVREERKKKTFPLPAGATEKTTVADASQLHNTPNTVDDTRLDDRATQAAERGSIACSPPREEVTRGTTPNNRYNYSETNST